MDTLIDLWLGAVVLSERILDRVKMCEIRSDCYGASDHVPIVMEVEGEL
jgi:AP endonuclease 1